jgi:predicted MFS family arabinose efflux permease
MASAVKGQERESEQPVAERGDGRSVTVMIILFLVFFLGVSDNQMVSPLLPRIADEFKLAPGDVGRLIGPAYALAAASVALLVGPASDKFGRRKFLLYASILFGVSLISVAFIRDLRTLTGVRFFTGLAAGTFSTCSIAYVGDYFPYKRRGTAMSVVQSGYFVALGLGVPVGSVLAHRLGWRSSFVAFGALSLIAFVLLLSRLPEDRPQMAEQDFSDRLARRFGNIRLVFESKETVAAVISAFFVSAGFVGFFYYLFSWLTKAFGFKTEDVGLIYIPLMIASLAGSLIAGPVADRFGKRTISIISTVVLAAGLLLIPHLPWGIFLLAAFLIAGLAFAFRQGPLQALATELVPKNARGALVATRNTASQVGIAASTAINGWLYDTHGYAAVGLFSAALTIGAAVCILIMKEPLGEKN